MTKSRCLGLIGGLGVGATVHYYRELVKAHQARGSELRLLIAHAHLPAVRDFVEAGNTLGLAQYLAGLIGQLRAGGAEVAAVPAVTPHLCAADLVRLSPLPLVNMLDVVERAIPAKGVRRVALFGTRFTMDSGMFGHLGGVEQVMPTPDEMAYIHAAYLQVAQEESGYEKHREGLTRLAQTLCERDRLDAIVLAGTDLSPLFDEATAGFPFIDCSRLHVDAIMNRLFD